MTKKQKIKVGQKLYSLNQKKEIIESTVTKVGYKYFNTIEGFYSDFLLSELDQTDILISLYSYYTSIELLKEAIEFKKELIRINKAITTNKLLSLTFEQVKSISKIIFEENIV